MSTATESKQKHTIEHDTNDMNCNKKLKVDSSSSTTSYVPFIANGYHSLNCYLSLPKYSTAKALEWYKEAFGAQELYRLLMRDGKQIMHAEIQMGTSRFMLSDRDPAWDPTPYEIGSAMTMVFFTPDCDALYERALKAGATSKRKPETYFYGDRSATVIDPFGLKWNLTTHMKDVSPEEMQRLGYEMEDQYSQQHKQADKTSENGKKDETHK